VQVLRNEDKYAKRSKARRHVLTERIIRPHTIRLMLEARQRCVLLYIGLSSGP
jgi:hypothetical protein